MARTREDIIEALQGKMVNKPEFIAGETYIPATAKVIDDGDILAIMDAALDGHFTEGKHANEFKKDLQRFVGTRFSLLTNSGSSANLLAMSSITQPEFGSRSLRPGDEVITTAVGFPTTLSSIIQCGAVPVFVDVDFPTYNASPQSVDAAISPKTKAIFLPHTLGNPFELEQMRQIADDSNLFLVGDACDSLGSTSNGSLVGSVEDLATFSFYPAHHITMGEGGAVVTHSPMLNKVMESIRGWGRACWCGTGIDNTCGKRFEQLSVGKLPYGYDHKYTYSRMGYNLKVTDMQAALGVSQLKKLPEFIAKRRHNHARLYENLQQFSNYFVLPEATKGANPSWFGFTISLHKSLQFNRSQLVQYLETKKVATRLLFGGNLLSQPAFSNIYHRDSEKLHNSNVITENTFWVGCHPGMDDTQVDYVSSVIGDFLLANRKK